MKRPDKLSELEILEIDAAITQIEEWSDDCPMQCPLGRLLKSVLKILNHCEAQQGGTYREKRK